jgi:hypothetical protein
VPRPLAANRYFNCLTPTREPLEWDPREPPAAGSWPNAGYFGRAFARMEESLRRNGLTFYLTFDVERLPAEGPDVVAVVVDNEAARIPAYAERIRATFLNLGARPQLGCLPFTEPSLLNALTLGVFVRNGLQWLPSGARYGAARLRGSLEGRHVGAVHAVPVGTFNQLDLPVKPLAERPTTIVFAGSVTHQAKGLRGLKTKVAPKGLSRSAMIEHAERVARRHPGIVADVGVTGAFWESVHSDEEAYSRRMMDAKVSLVPRGTVPVTARFLESLRYGCIVVADHVPPLWPYAQAPMIRVRDWSELEGALLPLLADEPRMQALHEQTLAWWHRACSEAAVGDYLAATLNALP